MGPQVRIDPETGDVVLDQQSLVVNTMARDDSASYDVVYENNEVRNSNYQRFRRRTPRGSWTQDETDKFYDALRKYGTDFTLITMLFPGRTRSQIRNKFKREEKENGPFIDLALKQRLPIEEDEHQMLTELAKKIAEEEKHMRELRERGELDASALPPSERPVVRPAVIAPIVGSAPEQPGTEPTETNSGGDSGDAAQDATPLPTEIVIDRSEYDAQNRYGDDEGHYADYDDVDDYGYGGGNDDY